MQKKEKLPPNELLSISDRLRYQDLIADLSYMEKGFPFYAVIGVEDDELGSSLLQDLKKRIADHEVIDDLSFSTGYQAVIANLSPEKCYLLPIFHIEDDLKNIAQHLLFYRDFVPDKGLRMIWLLRTEQYDEVLLSAYDFTSSANYTALFKNFAAQIRRHFKPLPEDSKLKRAYEQAEAELKAVLGVSDDDEHWWRKAVQIETTSNKEVLIRKWFNYALQAQEYNQWDRAIEIYKKTLQLNPPEDKKAVILCNLGNIFHQKGEWDRALQYHQESLKLEIQLSDLSGQARQLGNLSVIFQNKGEWDKALQYQQKSLELYQQLGNLYGQASQLGNLGLIFQDKGELIKALQYQQESLELYRRLGDFSGQASQLGNLGLTFYQKGEWDKALQYHQESLKIEIQLGNVLGQARQLGNLGVIFQDRGEWDKALQYHQESLALNQLVSNLAGQANSLGNIGLIFQKKEEWDKALKYQQESLKLHRQSNNQIGQASLLGSLGITFQYKGHQDKAFQYHQASLALEQQLGNLVGQARQLGSLGVIFSEKG
ncbi:MAG: tetratricopeptide repeat protein, partial [Bacteroidota bacterium]